MSKDNNKVRVSTFSGCTTKDMRDHIKPGAIIGDGDRKRASFLVLGLASCMDYKTTGLETSDHVGCSRFADRLILWSRWPQHSGNL